MRDRKGRQSAAGSISARAFAFLGGLPDHPLLDRIVRGRTWIALLGVMLVGIVAMQVEQLKLGASIGRSIERTGQLQTRNEQLQASIATLSDDQRIEALAARQGMIMPPPEAIDFLSQPQQTEIEKALSNIHPPDPSAFSSLQTGSGGVVTSADENAIGSPSGSLEAAPGTLAASTVATVPGAAATDQAPATGTTVQAPAASASDQAPATAVTGALAGAPATGTADQGPAAAATDQAPAATAAAPVAATGQAPAASATDGAPAASATDGAPAAAVPATAADQSPGAPAAGTLTPSGG